MYLLYKQELHVTLQYIVDRDYHIFIKVVEIKPLTSFFNEHIKN